MSGGGVVSKLLVRFAIAASLLLPWSSASRVFAQGAPAEGPLDDLGDEGPADEPSATPPADTGAAGAPAEGPAEGPMDQGAAEGPLDQGAATPGTAAEGEAGAEGGVSLSASTTAPPPPPPAAASGAGEELVVTGSRIKRTSFATPSAVEVVDRKQLAATGAQRMGDVVKNMDINSGSEFNTDVSTAAAGTANFNLRGLGLSSTLVLLNGRRLVQTATASTDGSNFVDINTIPVSAIERIEILKGGASAIYGSDAVAGVVNIITRKKMNGFEAQIGGQTTDNFDQREWDAALTGGASTERTRMVGTVTYFNRSPLDAEDRDFTKNGRNTSALGWPSAFVKLNPMGFTPVTRPTLDASGNTMPMLNADGTPKLDPMTGMPLVVRETDTFVDPGCGKVPLSAPINGGANPATDLCSFNFNSYYKLVAEEHRVNTYGSVEHDISDHTTIYFEAAYARGRTKRTLSPSFPILQTILIPADHRDNPFPPMPGPDGMAGTADDVPGTPLSWQGRVLGGNSPPTPQFFDSDTLHTAAGIKGDLGGVASGVSMLEDWEWELSGTWGMNRFEFGLQDILTDGLRAAVSSANCGPMSMNPAACLNPFTTGTPTDPALLKKLNGELRYKGDTELTTVGADINGPIVTLPGGDLSLAAGAQMRNESLMVDADHDSNQFAYIFLIGGPDYQADRRILAGYGELSLPFFSGFELQAAARVENYEDAGSSMNPMFGLSWIPAKTFMGDTAPQVSKVRLHGTYATTFRAPSLLQTGGAQTELREIYNFTPDMATGAPTQAARASYAAVRTLGNPNLDPEKATAITAGLEWGPVTGMLLSADYWRYNYDGIVVKEDAQKIVADSYQCNAMSNPGACDARVTRSAAGVPTQIKVEFVNKNSVVTHGVDFGLNYASDFGGTAGTFNFGATGSYVLSYEIDDTEVAKAVKDADVIKCSGGSCDVAGNRNFVNFARPIPRLRATVPLGWNYDMHGATVMLHYISSYQDDFNSAAAGKPADYATIDAWLAVDLQYAITIPEGDAASTKIAIGVQNLLDADPPKVSVGLGYDVFTHDPRGRILYARLTQQM